MNGNRLGNLRLYLWAALAMLLLYDYQAWMRDYAPPRLPEKHWRRRPVRR